MYFLCIRPQIKHVCLSVCLSVIRFMTLFASMKRRLVYLIALKHVYNRSKFARKQQKRYLSKEEIVPVDIFVFEHKLNAKQRCRYRME